MFLLSSDAFLVAAIFKTFLFPHQTFINLARTSQTISFYDSDHVPIVDVGAGGGGEWVEAVDEMEADHQLL